MKPSIETIDFHGIEALRLNGPKGSSAVISKLGGQVLSWMTPDGREHLYLSEKAVFDGSVAIRGGVPVCFPQFSGLGELPKHGLLRTRLWAVSEQACRDGSAMVCLAIDDDAETRAQWPHAFHAELTVVLDAGRLDVELAVDNTGDSAFRFTGALHSYLRVKEVENVHLQGLSGIEFRDAAKGDQVRRERGESLTIDDEVDRVYHDVAKPLLLSEGGSNLGIHAEGFPDVVVWNPWVERCAELPDMERLDFRRMLCVEAAVAKTPVMVRAGEEWFGRQTLVALG